MVSFLSFFTLCFLYISPLCSYTKKKDANGEPLCSYRIHQVEITAPLSSFKSHDLKSIKKVLRIDQRTGETFFLKIVPSGNKFLYRWIKIKEESPYKKRVHMNEKPLSL